MPYVKDLGGICVLCGKFHKPLEFHHTCYEPVRGVRICHQCHFNVHHQPRKLTVEQVSFLKQMEGKDCKKSLQYMEDVRGLMKS